MSFPRAPARIPAWRAGLTGCLRLAGLAECRFSGLTAVAPQDPKSLAAEIERGRSELGFKGVIINSHTQGEYLDDPKFWPIFEAAEALDTPVYLHPNPPYEYTPEEVTAQDAQPVDAAANKAFLQGIAEQVFSL